MTSRHSKSCTLCMLVPLILGFIGIAGLYWFAKENKVEYIENDLSLKSSQLLNDHKIGNVIVNMNWRDATITGTVISRERSDKIERILTDMPGIRKVHNQLEIMQAITITESAKIITKPKDKPLPNIEPNVEVVLASNTESTSDAKVVEELLTGLDLSGITFLFGSDEITPKGKVILDDVVTVLNKHPEYDVVIEGHTDSVGDDELNLQLSKQRAESVLRYLGNNGIDIKRLTATGIGELSPIAENDTVKGRALNRRIEFIVIK